MLLERAGDLLGDLPVGLVPVEDRLAWAWLAVLSFCIPSVPLIRIVGALDSGKAGFSEVIGPDATGNSLPRSPAGWLRGG